MNNYTDATESQVNMAMERSWQAFKIYRHTSIKERADFLRAIADEIESLGDRLVEVAMAETNLFRERLAGEKKRTIFQLTSYADACERGEWLQVRIDTGDPGRNLPKPDIRKTKVPLGPVVVFGASNFPFAYSTAGGDTACALAAGCTVVVKAHPAHPRTSEMVAGAIQSAAKRCKMPEGIFEHIYGASTDVGRWLTFHPKTKAIGFTGSYAGGKALFDWANQRKEPIPVFAEMGSVNPVYLFPEKLAESADEIAKMYAASITLSSGQFCTNPGLIVGIAGESLESFKKALAKRIREIVPETMLHAGISKAFWEKRKKALETPEVDLVAESGIKPAENQALPTIACTSAEAFCKNNLLHQEIFGPYSLVIECHDIEGMQAVAEVMEGQLTSTLMATGEEIKNNQELVDEIRDKCGRIIINGVPTGVEVCLSMHHGGPFPATTDSRFTAVGADGISRFARPVSYQNWPEEFLPDELKTDNIFRIWRTVNNNMQL